MFEKTDFEIPLEKQLRMRVINKEIDECRDIDELKKQLKQCAEVLMKYQHLLSLTLKRQMENDMTNFFDKMGIEIQEMMSDGE